MDLSKARFACSSVAIMLGISVRTVLYWCRLGKVKCEQKRENGEYIVYAESLVEFLYHNPKYANPYLERKMTGISYILQSAIRDELAKRPKSYSIQQIARRYHVTDNTVRYWVSSGYLNNAAKQEGIKGIFEKDLEKLFEKNPGIAKCHIHKEMKDDEEECSRIAV